MKSSQWPQFGAHQALDRFLEFAPPRRPFHWLTKKSVSIEPQENKTKNLLVTNVQERNGPCVALDSFKLHLRRGHLRLHFSDGHGRDFEGREVMPLVAFASELVAEVARRKRGHLRGLSVDLGRGILRATLDSCKGVEVVRIDGPEFESSVRPNSGALIVWAETHFDAAAECV